VSQQLVTQMAFAMSDMVRGRFRRWKTTELGRSPGLQRAPCDTLIHAFFPTDPKFSVSLIPTLHCGLDGQGEGD
jgi:hypothetical protein